MRINFGSKNYDFFLYVVTTLHSMTKIPPCELLFNHTVKELLPQLPCKKVLNKCKLAKANIENRKASNKRYQGLRIRYLRKRHCYLQTA